MSNFIPNSESYQDGLLFGKMLGLAVHGGHSVDASRKEASMHELEKDEAVQKMICNVGSYIFKKAGYAGCFEDRALQTIGKQNGPIMKVACDMFLTPVLESLAYFDGAVKEAAAAPLAIPAAAKLLPSVAGKAVGSTPEVIRNMMMLTGATGLTLGGLLWALNRSATQDDADVAAKEEQAAHYRQIAKDISKRIKLKTDEDRETKRIREAVEAEMAPNSSYVL